MRSTSSNKVIAPRKAASGLSALIPSLVLLLAGGAALAAATLLADGVEGQYVVVASPFGTPVLDLLGKSDALLIESGGFSNVMIVASDRSDFSQVMRDAGALLAFPAPRFLGCTSPLQTGS